MRKVKVAAASLCLLSYGMLRGGIINTEVSVAKTDLSDTVIEMTAETVTTAASIETTSIVTKATTAKTTAVTVKTTAVTTGTTASSAPATTTAVSTTEPVTESTAAPETTSTVQTEPEQFLALSSEQEVTELSDAAEAAASTQTETTASPEAESEVTAEAPNVNAITVTDREYCMLCNVVGHEYGANWVPEADKALVVEVIMNRVNSPAFPNTIYDVLMQRNQFAGLEYLVNMDGMSGYVTDSVKAAVDLYLADPTQFSHGYLYFNGDGYRNYFRTRY